MLIDLHTHTLPLSDDSELATDELIAHAKRAGLDAICLTEHDAFWSDDDIAALCRKHDFLILPGVEINTEEEHLLVFGLKKWILGMSRAAFVKEIVDKAGAAVIVAHPYRRKILKSEDPENKRYYRELNRACQNPIYRMVDAVEVFNARGSERQNAFSAELAERLKLRGMGGSDAHEAKDIGRAATFFERKLTTLQELIAELKAGRFRVANSSEIKENLYH
ncbi:MAG: PHP domain-containing protein [Dehalococcoidia bacterium]|nr:PHP domain-containing protein [Dehalococcoidia bacterium]